MIYGTLSGFTELHRAAQHGDAARVSLLLDQVWTLL